jgi:hypothetical protein
MDHRHPTSGRGRLREGEAPLRETWLPPEAAGRREALRQGTIARIEIGRRGYEARRRIARLLEELKSCLPFLWALALVLLSALQAASLGGCGLPTRGPEGSVVLLDAHEASTGSGYEAVISYRVTVGERLPVGRFGVTFRVASSQRQYWASDVVDGAIPNSASVVCGLHVAFSDPGERFVEGSAVLESAWFE